MAVTCIFVEPRGGLRHPLDIGITRDMKLARCSFAEWESECKQGAHIALNFLSMSLQFVEEISLVSYPI